MKLPSEYLKAGSGSSEYNEQAKLIEGIKKPFVGQSPDLAYPKGYSKPVFTRKPSLKGAFVEGRGGGGVADIQRFSREGISLMGGQGAEPSAVVKDPFMGVSKPKEKVIGKRKPKTEEEKVIETLRGLSLSEEEPKPKSERRT